MARRRRVAEMPESPVIRPRKDTRTRRTPGKQEPEEVPRIPKPLVDWFSCKTPKTEFRDIGHAHEDADAAGGLVEHICLGDDVSTTKMLRYVVLELHPADCTGPYLLRGLVLAGKIYLDSVAAKEKDAARR